MWCEATENLFKLGVDPQPNFNLFWSKVLTFGKLSHSEQELSSALSSLRIYIRRLPSEVCEVFAPKTKAVIVFFVS